MRIVPFVTTSGQNGPVSYGLPSTLEILDLSNNNFEQLERSSFTYFGDLIDLNLSSNLLENFEAVTFQGLLKLETLDLRNNKFKEVPTRALRVRYLSGKILCSQIFRKIRSDSEKY